MEYLYALLLGLVFVAGVFIGCTIVWLAIRADLKRTEVADTQARAYRRSMDNRLFEYHEAALDQARRNADSNEAKAESIKQMVPILQSIEKHLAPDIVEGMQAPLRIEDVEGQGFTAHLKDFDDPERAAIPLPERLTKALGMIALERMRQADQEGWTPEHDDEHSDGSLAAAAAAYALPRTIDTPRCGDGRPRWWPWSPDWWKPGELTLTGRLRDLEKAGALIVAEYERIQRCNPNKAEG